MVIPPGFANVIVPFNHVDVSREAVVTFGIAEESSTLITPTDEANAIQDLIGDTWGAAVDNNVTLGPVEVQSGTPTDPIVGVASGVIAGGAPNNSLPPNCALLVKKTGDTPGRSGRGRFYVPWAVAEDATNEAGRITPLTVDDFQALFTDFWQGLVDLDLPMRILHSTEDAPSGVTALSVDSLIATQRRRLGR